MNYWGKPASVQEISLLVRDPRVKGILSTDVPLLARQKGLRAAFSEGSVGRIKQAIDRGVPPIIMVASGGGEYHFFVVAGYSDRENRIVCEEYDDSKRLIAYEEVDRLWRDAGRLMLELEVSKADDYHRQGANLEAEGLFKEAVPLYQRAVEAEPDHYDARVGLGNCYLHLGKLEEALAEYKKAHALSATDPKVLNNLANVYLELKREPAEAERLSEQAAERYDAAWRRARQEMERETRPAIRAVRQREAIRAERDLAHAMGTLGQARAANGRHDLAVAAFRASYDHFPLTEFDFRARRLYEIALSSRALGMAAEARKNLERALEEARDESLRAKIKAALK